LVYEYGLQSISNGTGPYVPANDRTSVLNGEIAYKFDFSDDSILGLRVPSASRNLLWGSNNFGGSSWTRTNMTTSSVASPNTSTSATRVTATANNASLTQTRAGVSGSRRFYVFARSATSADVAMHMTLNAFSTVQSCNVTPTWTQFGINATLATPTLGIRLPNSGTSIDLWAADYETGTAATAQMTEVLINTTTSGTASALNDAISYAVTEFLPDDVTPREEVTIYHEVLTLRGSGATIFAANCEVNQTYVGYLGISVDAAANVLLFGTDINGDEIDGLAVLDEQICKISIRYTKSTQQMFVTINGEQFGPYPMGFPVALSHEGDSTTAGRTQHYIRKIGVWERVLSLAEIRALELGNAE